MGVIYGVVVKPSKGGERLNTYLKEDCARKNAEDVV